MSSARGLYVFDRVFPSSTSWPSHLILMLSSSNLGHPYCVAAVTCSHLFPLGLALGGVWGVSEGARRPLAVSNMRLRINSILNSVTRRGTFIGNSAGVLGAFWSIALHPCSDPTSIRSAGLQWHQLLHRLLPWQTRHGGEHGSRGLDGRAV